MKLELTEPERAAAQVLLGWVRAYEVVRVAPGRKLLRVTTPQDEEQYYSLLDEPTPRIVFHEPVRFVVTVDAAKGECRAGHRVGDRWEFAWCTPPGMCGAAYHAIYPVVHGLMLTSGRYEGPAAEETRVTCPDEGWITFLIQRLRWTPAEWEGEGAAEAGP